MIVLLVLIAVTEVYALPVTTVSQTIPAVGATSPNIVDQCVTLVMNPSSMPVGSSGFVLASCQSTASAIVFKHLTSATPTFVSTEQLVLMQMGYPCSFTFNDPTTGQMIGENLTSGNPVQFTDTNSNTTLYSGGGMGYNYCLYVTNIQNTGVSAFTITWMG